MSRRNVASRTSANEQEHSSGDSFRMPDPITAASTANTTMMHARFAPISISNSIPTVFNALNNPFVFSNETNSRLASNGSSDSQNFLFPTDRFNPPPLLQPTNIPPPYASIINNDPRFHSASAIFPANPLRQYNSIGIGANVAPPFDRFLQSFPAPQGSAAAMNPSSVPMISVASLTPTIPAAAAAAHHTSLLPTNSSSTEPSTSSSIPSSSIPLVNDQPYRYLLSFEQQAKIAHEAAMHYANLTEHLMEHARNAAAAAENMPLPPLPQAVFSMIQKYDQQKESLRQQQQQQQQPPQKQEEAEKANQPNITVPPFSFSDALIDPPGAPDPSTYIPPTGLLGQKRTSLAATLSEPMMKARHVENLSNTDTTPSRSESNSSNKTAAEILPILSPHPYCPAATENHFDQQHNEVEVDESGRKNTNVTQTLHQPPITSLPLRTIQERFNGMNGKYETKSDRSAHEHSLRSANTGDTTTMDSRSRLDSGISMSANSTEKQEQQILSWPTSFTVNNILVGNEGRGESDVLKHVAEPTAMMLNQRRALSPQSATAVMPANTAVLPPYSIPQRTIQNCLSQMGSSTIRAPFKSLPGYTVTANGVLITPDGRAIPPSVYNCFGIPRQPLASLDSNQEDDSNLCAICGDKASGNHYSVPSCEGCKGFFRRTIQKKIEYVCYKQGNCLVDQKNRNRCQSCRFKKCLRLGMRQESVRLDRNRRRKKDESREKEMEEIEEMKKLKATIVSAYREAFPGSGGGGVMIGSRSEAAERIHVFLNHIPMMEEISGRDREKVVDNGVYAALTLRTSFTTENYEAIVGVGSEALEQCVNGLGFDVKEEEMAILTAFCSLQNCMGMADTDKIQNIAAKLCNCLRVHLTAFYDGINELLCKCMMSVTALMLMQTTASSSSSSSSS